MKILIAENDCKTIDDISMVFNIIQLYWVLSLAVFGKQCQNIVNNSSYPSSVLH
jgi:hypothetical protein